MRCFLEVISSEIETRSFVNKKSGEIEEPQVLVVYALDRDFPQTMLKVQVWEKFQTVLPEVMRGAVIECIFRSIRPADGKYEKLDSISVSEENIRVIKSAAESLKEMAAELQKRANGSKKPDPASVTN